MANECKFYMSRFVDGDWETEISLEDYFSGMKYIRATGLDNYGKIKNIYTESYAETENLRVYIPDNVVRDNTDIEFEFGFEKENRRNTYHSFVNWVSGYKIKYRDTVRNREVQMILIDEVEIDEDILIGSSPYIVVPFKFKNLQGRSNAYLGKEPPITQG